jgi:hypothetical protein
VPGSGLAGISGVESGKAAPLVGGPPGIELHTTVVGLPSGDADTVPVVLATTGVGMVPNAVPDIIVADGIIVTALPAMEGKTMAGAVDGVGWEVAVAVEDGVVASDPIADDALGIVVPGKSVRNDVAGVADSKSGAVELAVMEVGEIAGTTGIVGAGDAEGVVAIVAAVGDEKTSGTAGVPGVICPVGAAQVTTVPGVAGSEANGTGANVVTGAACWVVAENGPGPLSGEVTIAAGVDESPMAVVPMVESCARLA